MSDLLNPKAKGSVEDFLKMGDQEMEAKEEEATPEEAAPMDPIDALHMDFGNLVPSRMTIEGWKAAYGSVHAYVPSSDSFFLFRPLRRIEHRNIMRDLNRLRESATAQEDPGIVEDQMHEKVIRVCLLTPDDLMSAESLNLAPAGLFRTLFSLVMEHSHFVAPEEAMQNCLRL